MPETRVWRDGMTVGAIGYAAVALFYALFDLVAARGTLFTVHMLSVSLFRGAPEPSVLQFPLEPWLAGIFWYNALHLLASLGIGLVVVALLDHARRRPSRVIFVQLVVFAGYVVTIAAVGLLSRTIREVLPWWSIVAVNTCAVALAGSYLLRRRPVLVAPVLSMLSR